MIASRFLAPFLLTAVSALSFGQTRFKVEKDGGLWWLETSNGSKFVSLGVCCLNTGTDFKDYDPSNPSYAGYRSYPDRATWASDVEMRLLSWNFNTVGAWSDMDTLTTGRNSKLYETPILNLGAIAGCPWKDLWSPATEKSFSDTADSGIKTGAASKSVIGYFSDNELGWWEGGLFDWIWKSDPNSGQRTHFVPILRKAYGSWKSVQKDFIPSGANSFDDLILKGRLYLRPGGSGMKVVQEYMGVLADRYYSLCRDTIKKKDPGALYLGDRYISNFYPEIAKAAGQYVDVLSSNLNGDWNDGTFAHFYLPDLEADCGKPILISEYYQSATENSSGNKNNSSGFPVVATQAERASRAEVSTKHLLSLPYIVGAHWFQYYDEPKNGRGDGENYDFGLVDVDSHPYDGLVRMFQNLNLNTLHTSGAPVPMDISSGIPKAPDKPSDLESWPRNRAYVPPVTDSQRADVYTCYSAGSLYVAVYWNEDRFAEAYYQDGKIPAEEFPQIHARIGGAYVTVAVPPTGAIPVTGGAKVVHEIRGVRNEVILEIPANSIDPKGLAADRPISFDVGLATRGRAYFGRWKGNYSIVAGS